jgi:hypothetical protein
MTLIIRKVNIRMRSLISCTTVANTTRLEPSRYKYRLNTINEIKDRQYTHKPALLHVHIPFIPPNSLTPFHSKTML